MNHEWEDWHGLDDQYFSLKGDVTPFMRDF
jgi:hypothetical protein